ncbi:hypothetical protein BLA13014_04127 [Burkholderia aenigmatica]|uniref:Uncharacterized protein n=1 Tax=Burkholderia aenigmatica TaxID=2015348 RepID=A0A6P2N2A0_9BURK|nr:MULTISPECIES: hypothetical protein [Burkholderia]VWB89092.1 hypothetical protein BLA13014_04127 [Burkholderia aenigmatica]
MTTNTYGGYTVAQLRSFIAHTFDTEHGGDTIDELAGDTAASANIVRDLLDTIEPQQDGDLLRPVARWVYNAVRVNLDLLHGICGEFGCPQGADVATWLRARLAGATAPCQCSGLGPCEQRTDGSCRLQREVDASIPTGVLAALNRMCTPLDESVLCGATAAADAHSMSVIRDYVLRGGAAPLGAEVTAAARDVLVERRRQVEAEGWTPEHDDHHADGSIALAAACYAVADNENYPLAEAPDLWPWDLDWWKPSTERRNLVKAGALILAEIERIDRAEAKAC